jgi:hypothetical protein
MDPEISGFENIIIRGLFLGGSRKTMLSKIDEIPWHPCQSQTPLSVPEHVRGIIH